MELRAPVFSLRKDLKGESGRRHRVMVDLGMEPPKNSKDGFEPKMSFAEIAIFDQRKKQFPFAFQGCLVVPYPNLCRMRIAFPNFSSGDCNVTMSHCVSMNHDFLA